MSGACVTCDGLVARLGATRRAKIYFSFCNFFVSLDAGLTEVIIQGQTLKMKCLTGDIDVEEGTNSRRAGAA